MTAGKTSNQQRTKIVGTHLIEHHELLISTQNRAWELVKSGAEEGVVVIADEQTCGRGRYQRKWYSPAGKGLYFSIILYPAVPQNYITFLPLAASIALHRTVEPLIKGNNLTIRWPNDLIAHGKKIAGILLEAQFSSMTTVTVVLGIGINISHQIQDFPSHLRKTAISLGQSSNSRIGKNKLLAEVLNHFDEIYASFKKHDILPLLDEWHKRSKIKGRYVNIRKPGGVEINGFVHSANIDGSITLIQNGRKIIVTAGDVEFC